MNEIPSGFRAKVSDCVDWDGTMRSYGSFDIIWLAWLEILFLMQRLSASAPVILFEDLFGASWITQTYVAVCKALMLQMLRSWTDKCHPSGIVRLHDCVGNFGTRNHRERLHDSVRVLLA